MGQKTNLLGVKAGASPENCEDTETEDKNVKTVSEHGHHPNCADGKSRKG